MTTSDNWSRLRKPSGSENSNLPRSFKLVTRKPVTSAERPVTVDGVTNKPLAFVSEVELVSALLFSAITREVTTWRSETLDPHRRATVKVKSQKVRAKSKAKQTQATAETVDA